MAQTTANEADGRISPDGRLIAYTSNESGNNEVYVRGLPRSADDRSVDSFGKVTVSRGGGNRMFAWRADGRELWYQTSDKKIMAVEVSAAPTLRTGEPRLLFQVPDALAASGTITGATDGRRFLMAMPVEGASRAPVVFLLNWRQSLKQSVK